jgi:hypothetical protein
MIRYAVLIACLAVSNAAIAGDYDKVNGSIHVDAGQNVGAVSTVNGSITIGDNATVTKADTVNGSITLGAHSKATKLDTVNGQIIVGKGADVTGALSNVNGDIRVDDAHVAGGIDTYNGSIEIGANSRIEGGIHLHKSSTSWFSWAGKNPRIVIGPGAVVQGTMRFDREVQLYVSDSATIGKVEGAVPIKFSGATPPN